jgi:hypothetical protein
MALIKRMTYFIIIPLVIKNIPISITNLPHVVQNPPPRDLRTITDQILVDWKSQEEGNKTVKFSMGAMYAL